jgi:DNA-binding NarL/FixJ family response regulator
MPKGKVTESESTEELLEPNSEGQSLTARQKEILSLVAQGFTNREIGEQLDISVRTVEVHRFNLMRRLRVRNVAQLLRQAIALRIIPQGPTTPTTKT